jgi:ABC-type branched-subunit amino acid transport system permease subunit
MRRGSIGIDLSAAVLAFVAIVALAELTHSKALVDFVIRVSAIGIFATSLNLLVGYTGMVSFGHGMFFASGAYVFGLLMQKAGVSIPVAFVLTLVLVAATPWCAVGLVALPPAFRAVKPVRGGLGGKDLIPVLRDTGLTMLVWAVAVAAALAFG